MSAIWTLARKELQLLVRDPLVSIILVAMPLLFILLLGQLLGENFGQPADDRLRVSVVDLDEGPCGLVESGDKGWSPVTGAAVVAATSAKYRTWSQVVVRDLAETAGIKVEVIPTREEAERLVKSHRRAAVLVFEPDFSRKVNRCSFLVDGVNPFHRDGVYLDKVGATLLKDPRQPGTGSI